MNPLKRKNIVEELSKERNLPYDDVDDIIYSYYRHVGNLVDSLEHTRLYINKICILNFMPKWGTERIEDFNNITINLKRRNETPSILLSISEYEKKVVKLKKLIELSYQELEIKRNKRVKRYEYINSLES